MNITRNNVDALNAIVTIELNKSDYEGEVEKVLTNYRKTANIPGFRKGTVPMSLIKKQYGKAVKLEELNKVLQQSLNKYMQDEKLEILGNPLPVVKEDLDLDKDDISFEFELGFAPSFDVDLSTVKNLTQYKVVADEKLLDDQVLRIRKQYGKMIQKDEVAEGDDLSGTFLNEEKGIDSPARFSLDVFKNKKEAAKFIGKKVGDIVTVNTKGLFDDDHKLMDYLKLDHDQVHGLDIDVDFKIEEVTATEPAELNEELFGKLFGEGKVSSLEDLKAQIKQDAEKQFAQQADQKFLNDVTESLISDTKFDLPSTFLKKWIQTAGEKALTAEQAEEEYSRSENGLRYQLIEGKIITGNGLQITFDDLKDYTATMIRKQMAQFGQLDPTEEDVNNIVARVLQNQDEIKRLSEQVMSEKMLNLFKEKVKAKTKEVSYEEFVKASYGE
ncbi:trigger factor [Flavobacterium silvaticum]|uniref:Trigger factor n=1 Tax=Flavobacterium silvaticum TaxID=1852020 RepID=A0A972FKP6_9FLAO|nr:trigger factor [Flavobacterium silvaticum]NMH27452.1 trigger factor [Flavobacterium silvaticum]